MWDPVGKKPSHVEEATADQKVLWSDRYRWDNPFDGYQKYVIRKECPGEESWGYWPGLGKQKGIANELQPKTMLAMLKTCNAPLKDVDPDNGNDLAIRLFDVLDSQYDVHGMLSASHPTPYKRTKDPNLVAIISSLESRISMLEDEKVELQKELQRSVSISQLGHIAASFQSLRSFTYDIRVRVGDYETVINDFSTKLTKWADGVSAQVQRLDDKLSSESFVINELVGRLNALTDAAVSLVSRGERELYPIGLSVLSEDKFLIDSDKLSSMMRQLLTTFEERKKQVPLPTTPLLVDEVTVGKITSKDVDYITVALRVLRLSRAISEMAEQYQMREREKETRPPSPEPSPVVKEEKEVPQLPVQLEPAAPQRELTVLEKLQQLDEQLAAMSTPVSSEIAHFLRNISEKFSPAPTKIDDVVRSRRAIAKVATALLAKRSKVVPVEQTMHEREIARHEKLKKRLDEIRQGCKLKIEQTLETGFASIANTVHMNKLTGALNKDQNKSQAKQLSDFPPIKGMSSPSSDGIPLTAALPPLAMGQLSREAGFPNFGQTVMSLKSAAGIHR